MTILSSTEPITPDRKIMIQQPPPKQQQQQQQRRHYISNLPPTTAATTTKTNMSTPNACPASPSPSHATGSHQSMSYGVGCDLSTKSGATGGDWETLSHTSLSMAESFADLLTQVHMSEAKSPSTVKSAMTMADIMGGLGGGSSNSKSNSRGSPTVVGKKKKKLKNRVTLPFVSTMQDMLFNDDDSEEEEKDVLNSSSRSRASARGGRGGGLSRRRVDSNNNSSSNPRSPFAAHKSTPATGAGAGGQAAPPLRGGDRRKSRRNRHENRRRSVSMDAAVERNAFRKSSLSSEEVEGMESRIRSNSRDRPSSRMSFLIKGLKASTRDVLDPMDFDDLTNKSTPSTGAGAAGGQAAPPLRGGDRRKSRRNRHENRRRSVSMDAAVERNAFRKSSLSSEEVEGMERRIRSNSRDRPSSRMSLLIKGLKASTRDDVLDPMDFDDLTRDIGLDDTSEDVCISPAVGATAATASSKHVPCPMKRSASLEKLKSFMGATEERLSSPPIPIFTKPTMRKRCTSLDALEQLIDLHNECEQPPPPPNKPAHKPTAAVSINNKPPAMSYVVSTKDYDGSRPVATKDYDGARNNQPEKPRRNSTGALKNIPVKQQPPLPPSGEEKEVNCNHHPNVVATKEHSASSVHHAKSTTTTTTTRRSTIPPPPTSSSQQRSKAIMDKILQTQFEADAYAKVENLSWKEQCAPYRTGRYNGVIDKKARPHGKGTWVPQKESGEYDEGKTLFGWWYKGFYIPNEYITRQANQFGTTDGSTNMNNLGEMMQRTKKSSSMHRAYSGSKKDHAINSFHTKSMEQMEQKVRRSAATFHCPRHSSMDEIDNKKQPPPSSAAETNNKPQLNDYQYTLGDTIQSPSHMIIERTRLKTFEGISALRRGDYAWVKRTNRTYTYALLIDRYFKPHEKEEGDNKSYVMSDISDSEDEEDSEFDDKKGEEVLVFRVNSSKSTKSFPESMWASFVRCVAPFAEHVHYYVQNDDTDHEKADQHQKKDDGNNKNTSDNENSDGLNISPTSVKENISETIPLKQPQQQQQQQEQSQPLQKQTQKQKQPLSHSLTSRGSTVVSSDTDGAVYDC